MARLNKDLVTKREQFAYNEFSKEETPSVNKVQNLLRNVEGLGCRMMGLKRIYEIRDAAVAKAPIPVSQKVIKVVEGAENVVNTEAPNVTIDTNTTTDTIETTTNAPIEATTQAA